MISTAQVMSTLQPWVSVRLLGLMEPLSEEIALKMNAYSSRHLPEGLRDNLDSLLFQALRHYTRGTMLSELPDGTWIRIRMEDISMMTDELMLLVFQQFPADQYHLSLLRDYSMRCSSLSALRMLYTRFAELQSSEELAAIKSVARSCHPAFRWREWLT